MPCAVGVERNISNKDNSIFCEWIFSVDLNDVVSNDWEMLDNKIKIIYILIAIKICKKNQ